MFVGKLYEKKSDRTKLKIVEGYRVGKKVKQRMIKDLGYLDELEQLYDDPIAHFTEVAKQMTEEKNRLKETIPVHIPVHQAMERYEDSKPEEQNRKNIGYAALSVLYHQLEIDYFLNNRRRYKKFEANLNSIFKLLVFNRALYPDSKKGAWEHRGHFFEDTQYSLEDVYRSLDYFLQWRPALLNHLHQRMQKLYSRDTLLMYYDVTNYYFEIDEADELRRKGVSKEHRPNPIVQMGLLMDEQGLPVTYDLFRGNMNDCTTFPTMLEDTAIGLDLHHLIVVADKGMMSGDNIAKIRLQHNGYVISYSVRGADQQFKSYVLDDQGYTNSYDSEGTLVSRRKSRITPRTIRVTPEEGKIRKTTINERQIVIYSAKYARKARAERQKVVEKSKKQIWSLSNHASLSKYGSAKYLQKVPYDTQTGEYQPAIDYLVTLDEQQIAEDEQLDGYYVICTNVIGLAEGERPFKQRFRYTQDGFFQLNRSVSDDDILAMYKGLWRIEETFKVTKSELKARPVFVSTEQHIRAHFFTCFVTLLLMRLLEYRLDWRHSAGAIQESLAQASGTKLEDNWYVFDYYDQVLADIGTELNLDFSRKYRSAQQLRSFIGATKKT